MQSTTNGDWPSDRIPPPEDLEKQGYPDLTGLIERSDTPYPSHDGGFSDVYIGYAFGIPNWKVAIKVLRTTKEFEHENAETIRRRLNREAIVWSKLKHRNILRFLGLANVIARYKNCTAMISPYCVAGTVRDYTHRVNLTEEARLSLVLGIVHGMGYLHGMGIIHGSMTPLNVLIGNEGEPLISDFGQSFFLGVRGFTTRPAGVVRYQAPELLADEVPPNTSTDLYSLAATAFEVWTRVRPFDEIHNDVGIIMRVLVGKAQPRLPNPTPAMTDQLWPVLSPCFDHIPEKRPSIRDITQRLESSIQALRAQESSGVEIGLIRPNVVQRQDIVTSANGLESEPITEDSVDDVSDNEKDDGYDAQLMKKLDASQSTPLNSHSLPDHERTQHQIATLLEEVATGVAQKRLKIRIVNPGAQILTDFLSKFLLDDTGTDLPPTKRRYILQLLSKVVKATGTFPQFLVLQGIQCKLDQPINTDGGFGDIYQGELGGRSVCVKTARAFQRNLNHKKRLRAQAGELIIWSHLAHQNILPFYGLFFSPERVRRVCIVSPWMDNGDLVQFLRTYPDSPRIPLLHDIISGLGYLHEYDIVHADLKGKNVLVSNAKRAMLADFGLSKVSMTLPTTTSQFRGGTTHWMAPELHEDDAVPDKRSDIWAFGCTCYEVLSGEMPFSSFRAIGPLIRAFIEGTARLHKPVSSSGSISNEVEKVWPLVEECCKQDPAHRPETHMLVGGFASLNTSDERLPDVKDSINTNIRNIDIEIDYSQVYSILRKITESEYQGEVAEDGFE
ncbi:hypothetical protein NP233_g4258 [Leucocoprinus birnbaumii]|uniref:Protein kinase domain-containing protein n=1 Tax=Leucocoprinus birnbaumii TaxID=56174 RepID=A0AAD5VV01_9AGAR|nr:hypothetical protein NP233_g4258 [Leucocoprinus birnbaumii]